VGCHAQSESNSALLAALMNRDRRPRDRWSRPMNIAPLTSPIKGVIETMQCWG
jgi:hypothetical protein